MINRVFSFLGQMIPAPFFALYLDKMLPPRNDRHGIGFRVVVLTIWTASSVAAKVFFPRGWWTDAAATVHIGLLLLLAYLLYGGKPWKRLCAATLLLVTMFMADMIYLNVCTVLTGREFSLDFGQPDMAMASVLADILLITLMPGTCWLWQRVNRMERGRSQWGTYILFLLMEVPFFLVFILSADNYSDNGYIGWNYIMVFISLFCSALAAAIIFISRSEREAMAERLQEFRQASELERQYFRDVEARQEEMSKLRHDYNNLLSSAVALLREGSASEAEKLLLEVSDSLLATRARPYCAVPVVNAVLAEKEATCEKEGVQFEVRLMLPGELPIDRIDLCRALSNLMDNAIRGSAGAAERRVQLSGGVVRGYVVIKCVNTVPAGPPPRESSGTGYGMQILNDLASRYEGDFYTERGDGCFTAQLSLSAKG